MRRAFRLDSFPVLLDRRYPSYAVRPQSERFAKLDSRNPPPKRPLPVTSTVNRPLSPRNLSPKNNTPRLNISRSLNSIPESTTLPDSPSSFPPPSSNLINHKPRGTRLLDGAPPSDASDVRGQEIEGEQKPGASNGRQGEPNSTIVQLLEEKPEEDTHVDDDGLVESDELAKPGSLDFDKDTEINNFYNPNCSVNKLDRNLNSAIWKPSTPSGEYFDAFEELSSCGTSRSYSWKAEELHDLKLNTLLEVERRKQAEEETEALQNQWQILSHHLSLVGLKLPAPTSIRDVIDQPNINPAEDLCQQIVVSRIVADAVGRAITCAESELTIQPLIQSKNFEIARLQDRLQYYETANKEMSQRNQEALVGYVSGAELARQRRNKRKRQQRWIWSSIALAVTLGVISIAWPCLAISMSSRSNAENFGSNVDGYCAYSWHLIPSILSILTIQLKRCLCHYACGIIVLRDNHH
ncbi:uncharacterized protein LOC122054645 [Zingiber officinale]|uniref:uncharacterized protein LOC122054645 n=1 Tax=Zingiber officinale TaxID=94328 RepID=UPI001C4C2CA0|nr:uncharacterized protein LOC122054645 [Zingiber officinale]